MRARRQPYIDTVKRRTEWAFYFFFVWFLFLSYQLFNIQVRQHAHFKKQAARYHNRRIQVDAVRGILYDRHGTALTQNLPLKSVYADPSLIDDPAATARQLAGPLRRSPQYLEKCLRREGSFAWLRRKVDRQTEQAVRALNLKGIDFVPETKRAYPLKSVAANLIGFTDIDGKGVEGLEQQLRELIAYASQGG